jgi:hypothetical protein
MEMGVQEVRRDLSQEAAGEQGDAVDLQFSDEQGEDSGRGEIRPAVPVSRATPIRKWSSRK